MRQSLGYATRLGRLVYIAGGSTGGQAGTPKSRSRDKSPTGRTPLEQFCEYLGWTASKGSRILNGTLTQGIDNYTLVRIVRAVQCMWMDNWENTMPPSQKLSDRAILKAIAETFVEAMEERARRWRYIADEVESTKTGVGDVILGKLLGMTPSPEEFREMKTNENRRTAFPGATLHKDEDQDQEPATTQYTDAPSPRVRPDGWEDEPYDPDVDEEA